ncbi:MAG TPA: hypothetical protein VLM85_05315 [Polyangiaceae bacterium]|nr:hypothetical protein [Polyangiaceae bacterium]
MSARLLFLPLFAACGAAAFAACGGGDSSRFDAGDGSFSADSPSGVDSPFGNDAFTGPYSDFPSSPVVDSPDAGQAAPPNSQQLFGDPDAGAQSGGPCLVEPEVGSLYPRNWLRPRFHWIAPGGENLFELRIHAANQVNDLVVYTAQTTWTMPKAMWDGLRMHSNDQPMSVSIRGGVYASPSLGIVALGSNGPIGIAPVDAPGAIVYWTTSGGSALKGFSIGDETVVPVLTPGQVQEFGASCIGCHTSTPDGLYVEVTSSNGWNNAIADVEQGKTGQVPPFLGAAGKAALEQAPRGISTFSPAHWGPSDYVTISTLGNTDLSWVDLSATSGTASGIIARNGDGRHGGAPTWSHDGNTIVYVSTDAIIDGRLANGPADLWSVPYNNRAGGTAQAIPGASDANWEEYYPIFSPDDQLLAFDRVASGSMYNNAAAEVYVIPSAGGTPTRLAANDPPACSGKASPGITNSWPKWAPQASTTGDGRVFYWVVFSSTRDEAGNPQLYVAPVVVSGGTVRTYQALYLWNQPANENNHTPAWDVFKIPPPPVQ